MLSKVFLIPENEVYRVYSVDLEYECEIDKNRVDRDRMVQVKNLTVYEKMSINVKSRATVFDVDHDEFIECIRNKFKEMHRMLDEMVNEEDE